MRIVVADAIGTGDAASRIAAGLVDGGYRDVTVARATSTRRTSAVFYNDGFERQAGQLAALVGVDEVVLHPFGAITVLDERGDVWLLVGRDLT